jgi:hypothetical protein
MATSSWEAQEATGLCCRTCPDCSVTITVQRPHMPLSSNATRSARDRFAAAIRAQVLWAALCPACRRWWGDVILSVQERA